MFTEKWVSDGKKSLISSVCCAEQIDLNTNLRLRTPRDIQPFVLLLWLEPRRSLLNAAS